MTRTAARGVRRRLAVSCLAAVVAASVIAGVAPVAAIDPGLDDVIRLGGITYVAQESAASAGWPEPVPARVLGARLARVACRMTPRARCPGDVAAATMLPPGTPIHAVQGYRSAFRLAAYRPGGDLALYEALDNPRATRGADLYDLAGKVAVIEVIREDRTDAASIHRSFARPDGARVDDPELVARFVDLILAAPVVPPAARQGTTPRIRYWLTFRFHDGTATGRAYHPDTGHLARALALPPEFRTLVEDAVHFIGGR